MKNLYEKALLAYIDMLTLHIDTKTTDSLFHNETENYYNVLFDVAHQIGEKEVDLDGTVTNIKTLKEKKEKANKIISNLLLEIEKYKNENKLSLGTEDLIGTLANNLEGIKGSSKSFLN